MKRLAWWLLENPIPDITVEMILLLLLPAHPVLLPYGICPISMSISTRRFGSQCLLVEEIFLLSMKQTTVGRVSSLPFPEKNRLRFTISGRSSNLLLGFGGCRLSIRSGFGFCQESTTSLLRSRAARGELRLLCPYIKW